MEASSQKNPLSTIKPIKYRRQNIILNPQTLPKYRVYHPKNLETINSPPSNYQVQSNQSLKSLAKILETQDVISSANYPLHSKTAFQNSFFSSKIRNLSTSLSSFKLESWDQINCQTSKDIFKCLTSLENLQDFDIHFLFCQFPTTNDLASLFNCLAYLKKMKHFSFRPSLSPGFELKHWNALCSSLTRSSQIQDLNLTFDGGDKFLEILIPKLSKLASLTKLHLSLQEDNLIQAENIIKLFLALSTRKSLTDITLLLTPCRIAYKNTFIEPFAEGLQCLNTSSIRKLGLDLYKNLTDSGLVKICQTLSKFRSLEILRIGLPDSQEITDEGLAQLSSTISKLGGSLASISLCVSGFSHNLAFAFKSLQNLVNLSLNLQNPNLSLDQVQQLSSSLKALKPSLKFLEVKFAWKSSLSDSMIENLAAALQELTLLKILSLNLILASSIKAKGIETLSGVIQRLSNLSCLDLILANDQGLVKKTEKTKIALPSLNSIDQINSERNTLQGLFDIICEMKNLYQLQMKLPVSCGSSLEMTKLKQRFNLYIHEASTYLKITTF